MGDEALEEMKVDPEEESRLRMEGELVRIAGRRIGCRGGQCLVEGLETNTFEEDILG